MPELDNLPREIRTGFNYYLDELYKLKIAESLTNSNVLMCPQGMAFFNIEKLISNHRFSEKDFEFEDKENPPSHIIFSTLGYNPYQFSGCLYYFDGHGDNVIHFWKYGKSKINKKETNQIHYFGYAMLKRLVEISNIKGDLGKIMSQFNDLSRKRRRILGYAYPQILKNLIEESSFLKDMEIHIYD